MHPDPAQNKKSMSKVDWSWSPTKKNIVTAIPAIKLATNVIDQYKEIAKLL